MSVVPSIIVLVITALLVFRYELTHLAASASKPTPAPQRRPLRQSKASQEFGRGASRSAPSTGQMRLCTSRAPVDGLDPGRRSSMQNKPFKPLTPSAAEGCDSIEGDQEVMRTARFDPNARGIDCAAGAIT
jgi:hypothetical protein